MAPTLRRAALGAALLLLALPSAARADIGFVSPGPIASIEVSDDLACQVAYAAQSTYEFFPPDKSPGDCGTLIAVDGTLYAPDFDEDDASATSQLGNPSLITAVNERLTGSGTATDPFVITTDATVDNGQVAVQQRVSYAHGQPFYRVDIAVRNLAQGASKDIRVYHAGDCYASGSDIGHGFTRPEIKSFGCAQNVNNTPAARTIQMLPLSPGSAGVEDRYAEVWRRIGALETLDNTCKCDVSLDNGVALGWQTTLGPIASAEYSLRVAFTESQAPAMADSDGDALPDAWETGTGTRSDAENLAPLGASATRKDIFVHVDWMGDCKPAGDFARKAIEMFESKGIALHVDAGSDSLFNLAGETWGTRSRAGAIDDRPDLAENDWATFDTFKDRNFIPSGRRRAFIYVAYVRSYDGSNGSGQARGIPDSDIVIANCKTSYAQDVMFVHELGHALGLYHGGNTLHRFKPNYYSAMNYAWAKWALVKPTWVPYSDRVQAPLNEGALSERATLTAPVTWHCPKDGPGAPTQRRFDPRNIAREVDFNCNGVYNESNVKVDLDREYGFETVNGFDDWGAIKYGGAGIIGALTLPQRGPDTPVEPEFGTATLEAVRAAEQAEVKRDARELVITTKTVQLRKPRKRGRTNTLRVVVRSQTGKAVRDATIRVKGAKSTNKGRKRTNRRGQFTLTLKISSKKEVRVTAAKKRYTRSTVIVPVIRRR